MYSFGYVKELIRKVTFQKVLDFKDLAANRKNIIKLTTVQKKKRLKDWGRTIWLLRLTSTIG